jgi:uncharacterized protein (TIGR03067 family)
MRILLAFTAAILLVAAEPPADAVKKDLAALEGDWAMVSAERDGQAVPAEYVKAGKREFKDGKVKVSFGDMVFLEATVTIDPSKKPKHMDYDVTDGAAKGQKQLGIYEIDGDTIKFCFASADQGRPTDFTTKEGSGRTASVWKKVKK